MIYSNLSYKINKCLIWFILFALSLPSWSQQSLSLGDLKFIMPSNEVQLSSRSLTMRMATTGISPKIFSKVGGVALIQTAVPDMSIDNLQLGCNLEENTAYVTINDTIFPIPLEVWELKSIVKFADDEYNAAVTLFGDNNSRIKYHPAFIDNLMGLRILQTDLLLASNFLNISDRGRLPQYDNGMYIMSDAEKERYSYWCMFDSAFYDTSYENVSIACSLQLGMAIDSINENFDTYIYTDYDQPISFKCVDGEIQFEGKPYYRFAKRDSVVVDTIEMYYELKNFIDTFNLQKEEYKNLSIKNIYNKRNNPTIYKAAKLLKNRNNTMEKAINAMKLLDYYRMCDSLDIEDRLMSYLNYSLLKIQLTEFTDSILSSKMVNKKLMNLCTEFKSMVEKISYDNYPILTEYATLVGNAAPNDSLANRIASNALNFGLTYERYMIEYLYNNRVLAVKEVSELTSYLRGNFSLVYLINPIIFDASFKVCRWSAFFRFVKQNYINEWNIFKGQVERLMYDAPIVQTPIDFDYE